MNLPSRLQNFSTQILTVSELNRNTKEILEQSIPLLWVHGEISNLKCYPSGHWYFSLKDSNAQVRCVFFSHKNYAIDWQLKEGMQIEVLALVTLYESRGDYQLNIETMRQAGLGKLYEAFERLKKKLENAGLFRSENKKPLPIFPKRVGIITSPNTAALRDVLVTLQRRTPSLPIIIYPAVVQGKMAAEEIAHAIDTASKRKECDALILCRGGGSIEDLWAFNEEIVALAITRSCIPIISGIGHETDFTIADFVADQRASTPTGAAELISQDQFQLSQQLKKLFYYLNHAFQSHVERMMQKVDTLSYRLIYPSERVKSHLFHMHYLAKQLTRTMNHELDKKSGKHNQLKAQFLTNRLDITQNEEHLKKQAINLNLNCNRHIESLLRNVQLLNSQLSHLNPQSVLARGYSMTFNAEEGTLIHHSKQIKPGDNIQVKFADSACDAKVIKIYRSLP
ncbi:MAG: exodeoxyribonuclease VII large subunit [Nitrosomonas sp.]